MGVWEWGYGNGVVFEVLYCVIQVAMVAWRITMLTPQFPEGREIIVIGNDITHDIGTFGPQEDQLFKVHVYAPTS